jgi:hypothetical protein
MTREEIINGTPKWLNEQTLKYLGIEYTDEPEVLGRAIAGSYESCWYKNSEGKIGIVRKGQADGWNPAGDIRDAMVLEEKVKEMGLIDKYIYGFIDAVGFETVYYDGPMPTNEGLFQIAHATPEQRTKAFLLATEPGN